MGGRGPARTPNAPQGPLDLLKEDSSYGLRGLWGREDPLWAWWKEGGWSPLPEPAQPPWPKSIVSGGVWWAGSWLPTMSSS